MMAYFDILVIVVYLYGAIGSSGGLIRVVMRAPNRNWKLLDIPSRQDYIIIRILRFYLSYYYKPMPVFFSVDAAYNLILRLTFLFPISFVQLRFIQGHHHPSTTTTPYGAVADAVAIVGTVCVFLTAEEFTYA